MDILISLCDEIALLLAIKRLICHYPCKLSTLSGNHAYGLKLALPRMKNCTNFYSTNSSAGVTFRTGWQSWCSFYHMKLFYYVKENVTEAMLNDMIFCLLFMFFIFYFFICLHFRGLPSGCWVEDLLHWRLIWPHGQSL